MTDNEWRCTVHHLTTTGDCPKCDDELVALTEAEAALAAFNDGTRAAIEANRGREAREKHAEACRASRART